MARNSLPMTLSLGLLLLSLQPLSAFAETVTFTYDRLNRLKSATYSEKAITYSYDSAGNMTRSVAAPFGTLVNGICGADNGRTLDSPPQSLCLQGTASAVSGIGPWNWSCIGSGGGTPAACSAAIFTATVDSRPPAYSGESSGTITFSANSAATFQCQLDGGSFTPCTSTFTYSNLAPGQHTFTLRATNAGGAVSTTTTTFTVVAETARVIAPESLNAGTLPVGATGVSQPLVLINTGASPLTIAGIPATAGDFAISHACPDSLPAGGNCVISAVFSPTAAGNRNATLTITDSIGPLTVPLSGIGTIIVSGILADPVNAQSVVTGLDGAGVYRSSDGGTTWTPATVQPANLRVTALAAAAGQFSRIFAATRGSGLFVSDDSGATWSACANMGLTNLNVLSLAIDTAAKLYAGTEAGVFSSANGCADWTETNAGLPE